MRYLFIILCILLPLCGSAGSLYDNRSDGFWFVINKANNLGLQYKKLKDNPDRVLKYCSTAGTCALVAHFEIARDNPDETWRLDKLDQRVRKEYEWPILK